MRLLMVALMLLPSYGLVRAQDNTPRAYDALRSSDSYRKAVTEIYASYESSLSTHCPKVDVNMNTSNAKVLGPFETDANGQIVNGHWKETTEGIACGVKRLYNASITIKDGKSQVEALFPGHSYAGPQLQRDAVQYAAIGAGAVAGCVADILDTTLPNGAPSGPKLPWVEKWTVRVCGKRMLVTIRFVPDATGTTIEVAPKETVVLP
ncbi:MAG: hypothetical protein ABI357_08640 [Granulicella sp.]